MKEDKERNRRKEDRRQGKVQENRRRRKMYTGNANNTYLVKVICLLTHTLSSTHTVLKLMLSYASRFLTKYN